MELKPEKQRKISEVKRWLFVKINEIDRPLARLTGTQKIQITNISLATGCYYRLCRCKRVIREFYEQVYTHKFENLDEID